MFKKDIISENPIDLKNIIYNEIDCSIPVLLISAPGYDPSKKIENISKIYSNTFDIKEDGLKINNQNI